MFSYYSHCDIRLLRINFFSTQSIDVLFYITPPPPKNNNKKQKQNTEKQQQQNNNNKNI